MVFTSNNLKIMVLNKLLTMQVTNLAVFKICSAEELAVPWQQALSWGCPAPLALFLAPVLQVSSALI
jgi:hypothetical protein